MPPVAAAADWTVEAEGIVFPVASRELDGAAYLAADDLARAFGGRLTSDPRTGSHVMEIEGHRIILSGREGLASVEGRIVSLPRPNHTDDDGRLWVDPEVVEKVVAPFLPGSLERDGTRFRVRGASAVRVLLRSSHDLGGSRVVLELSRTVRYEHTAGPGGAQVKILEGPLELPEIPSSIGGDTVGAVRFEPAPPGGTFLFDPGPAYARVRISRLRDPFRIVLDFDRASRPAAPASPDAGGPDGGPRPAPTQGIRRVILDPGHGGSEVGAQGPTGLFEKDVVLDVAFRTARLLRDRLGLETMLTREADLAVPLDDRAGFANYQRGDLFLSIHANASRGSRASGAETYFLAAQASDEQARQVAAAENLAGGPADAAGDETSVSMVLWDMAHSEFQQESSLLAETIQREMNELLGTRDRGVRQAPFRVLMGTQMPGILVEVAFISNPAEEASLRTPEFKNRIAEAIARGVAAYKRSYEERIGPNGAEPPLPGRAGP